MFILTSRITSGWSCWQSSCLLSFQSGYQFKAIHVTIGVRVIRRVITGTRRRHDGASDIEDEKKNKAKEKETKEKRKGTTSIMEIVVSATWVWVRVEIDIRHLTSTPLLLFGNFRLLDSVKENISNPDKSMIGWFYILKPRQLLHALATLIDPVPHCSTIARVDSDLWYAKGRQLNCVKGNCLESPPIHSLGNSFFTMSTFFAERDNGPRIRHG